jgi:glycosyltransferase involved in cell wall biosynthesis
MAGGEVGGAEAFFVRLAGGLDRAGVDQRLVVRRHPARAALLRDAGLDPVELAFGGWLDATTTRRLGAEIADFAPDVVLSWMSRASRFCARARRVGGPVLIARHGGDYKLKYYRGCDHLIGNTPEIVDRLRHRGWPAERAHFIPNFVDAAPAEAVSRQALETPPGVPVLLALGRLHRNKAFDVAIQALAELPEAVLWIAGDGKEKAALAALAERLGVADRVRWLGWRDDVAALLAAADVLVCPSRIEPLGNVIIEAWAHGRPRG